MVGHLPVLAKNVGGDLPVVLQWEQHALLPASTKYVIAKIIAANPKLNTESRVDMLADLAGYHGEHLDEEVIELIDEYGPERVYLVIDFLYEIGKRNREGGYRPDLQETLEVFEMLEAAGIEVDGFETIERLVNDLGGIAEIASMSPSAVDEAVNGP